MYPRMSSYKNPNSAAAMLKRVTAGFSIVLEEFRYFNYYATTMFW